MPYLKSLPDDAVLLQVFRAYPDTARPLLDYHELVMRGPSPFTVAERELIAAYVSGVNECGYCHGVHTATAEAFGIQEGLIAVQKNGRTRVRKAPDCEIKSHPDRRMQALFPI